MPIFPCVPEFCRLLLLRLQKRLAADLRSRTIVRWKSSLCRFAIACREDCLRRRLPLHFRRSIARPSLLHKPEPSLRWCCLLELICRQVIILNVGDFNKWSDVRKDPIGRIDHDPFFQFKPTVPRYQTSVERTTFGNIASVNAIGEFDLPVLVFDGLKGSAFQDGLCDSIAIRHHFSLGPTISSSADIDGSNARTASSLSLTASLATFKASLPTVLPTAPACIADSIQPIRHS